MLIKILIQAIKLCFSRVHVTRATMEQLNGRFAVEPGNGGSREGYLADHKVETFLIIHPSEKNVSIFADPQSINYL